MAEPQIVALWADLRKTALPQASTESGMVGWPKRPSGNIPIYLNRL